MRSEARITAHIARSLKYWRPRFGMEASRLTVHYTVPSKYKGKAYALCSNVHPEFESVMLWFDVERMAKENITKRDVEGFVVHELLHGLLWPLSEGKTDSFTLRIEDTIIQRLVRALITQRYGVGNDDL